MGGASGGFTAARKEIVELLRQRSRRTCSAIAGSRIVYTTLKVIDILKESTELRDRLERNMVYFRAEIEKLGFQTTGADMPLFRSCSRRETGC